MHRQSQGARDDRKGSASCTEWGLTGKEPKGRSLHRDALKEWKAVVGGTHLTRGQTERVDSLSWRE